MMNLFRLMQFVCDIEPQAGWAVWDFWKAGMRGRRLNFGKRERRPGGIVGIASKDRGIL
jgi:hypothetical protein